MTEEDIKQKAKEYTNKNDTLVMGFEENLDCTDQMQQAFIAGYHECQKEHEWHYVQREGLPKEEKYYLVLSQEWGYEIRKFILDLNCFECRRHNNIIKWKEIE